MGGVGWGVGRSRTLDLLTFIFVKRNILMPRPDESLFWFQKEYLGEGLPGPRKAILGRSERLPMV